MAICKEIIKVERFNTFTNIVIISSGKCIAKYSLDDTTYSLSIERPESVAEPAIEPAAINISVPEEPTA